MTVSKPTFTKGQDDCSLRLTFTPVKICPTVDFEANNTHSYIASKI